MRFLILQLIEKIEKKRLEFKMNLSELNYLSRNAWISIATLTIQNVFKK